MPLSAETRDELITLLWAQAEGELTADQHQRLEALVTGDPECREYYVRFLHLRSSLHWNAAREDEPQTVETLAIPATADWSQPASASPDLAAGRRGTLRRALAATRNLAQRPQLVSLLSATAFVLSCLALLAVWRISYDAGNAEAPQPVARISTLHDCSWEAGAEFITGAQLRPGDVLRLARGQAKVSYNSGAEVHLTGPATFEVESAATGRLLRGQLLASVPQRAQGFSVGTPGATVVDLGTQFGMLVDEEEATEVHVFVGTVEVRPLDGSRPIALRANQALVISAGRVRRLQAAADQFAEVPSGFQVFSTGAGLPEGQADPRWRMVSASGISGFAPQQAVVTRPHPRWEPDLVAPASPPRSRWIGLAHENRAVPTGCEVTFRTTFRIDGLDPATARLQGQFAADNEVVSWRLNGRDLGLAKGSVNQHTPLEIASGFRSGENVLEVVVRNTGDFASPMGLLIEWSGTARKPPRSQQPSPRASGN